MNQSNRIYNSLVRIKRDYFYNIQEYQDKYFFVKKIKKEFPSLNEDEIYSAINYLGKSISLKSLSHELAKQIQN